MSNCWIVWTVKATTVFFFSDKTSAYIYVQSRLGQLYVKFSFQVMYLFLILHWLLNERKAIIGINGRGKLAACAFTARFSCHWDCCGGQDDKALPHPLRGSSPCLICRSEWFLNLSSICCVLNEGGMSIMQRSRHIVITVISRRQQVILTMFTSSELWFSNA